ncbi:MATE efflux family protein [Auricularia subglabra TFB-10046 SS5]|nr:MATE efflux family protein [Auricularia subglabra TFB-10046 SS5]
MSSPDSSLPPLPNTVPRALYGSKSRAPPKTAPLAASAEPPVQVVRHAKQRRRTTEPGIQDAAWWTPGRAVDTTSDERTPLLTSAQTPGLRVSLKSVIYHEGAILAGYAIPAFITHFLEYSLLMAPIISIGHLSTTALAAGTLASMTASVTGLTIAHSFASALDTMLPPAWTSGNPRLVGLWTQRMLVLITVLNVPILIIWWNAERLLLLLRQDPDVAHLAAIYLRWLSLGLPAFTLNAVLRRGLTSFRLFTVPTQIILVVAPLNAVLDYILGEFWGPPRIRLGFIGGPLATAVSFNLVSLLSIVYLLWLPTREAWHPFTRASFQDLGILLYLGVAGIDQGPVAQIATEWWAWEIINRATIGRVGKTSLAAQSVLLVSCTTTYQAPYSIALGTAVRVGNLLGEENPSRARFHLTAPPSAMFVLLRERWAYIFNSDPEVISLVAGVLPLVGALQLLDGLSAVGGGILRACGKQVRADAYYVIGIPLGLFLTFDKKLGLLGLWLGLSVSLVITTTFELIMTMRLDWDAETARVRRRLQSSERPPPSAMVYPDQAAVA